MGKIKAFAYLDDYKMYSISSQIFEGLTEHITSFSAHANKELEQQEGPFESGRVLADIINVERGKEERKFLHDYSYTLFEQQLFDEDRVLVVNSENIGETLDKVADYSFIKVSGRILFNDIAIINNTLERFNEIGEAIAYVSTFESLKSVKTQYEEALAQEKNPQKKAGIKNEMKKALDIQEIARKSSLHHDEEFLKKLALILDYGYKDQFEVQINIPISKSQKTTFSANLTREYLKETEHLLIKKHSRYSEKDFVIFGMITQNQGKSPTNQDQVNSQELKEILVHMISKLSEIEEKFTGKLQNEIVIDPIAVYREL